MNQKKERLPKLDVDAIKLQSRGNWHLLFQALIPNFDPVLLEKAGRKHGPCPLCEGTDRFQFYKDGLETGGSNCRHCGAKPDGFDLVAQANDTNFIGAVRRVNAVLNGEDVERGKIDPEVLKKAKERQEKAKLARQKKDAYLRENLKRVWKESVSMEAPEAAPARRYLENRGLSLESFPPTLRFHPGMKSFDSDRNLEGQFPTMLGLIVDKNGDPVSIHRTFLTDDGRKAPVESAKKIMEYPSDRDMSGGAIHLSGTGRVLNVAEGIETALAVGEMVGGSLWATVNSSMMRNLQIGEPVTAVWAWADLDRSGDGQQAAMQMCERAKERGLEAHAEIPPIPIPAGAKSVDWLDVYCKHQDMAGHRARFARSRQRRVA